MVCYTKSWRNACASRPCMHEQRTILVSIRQRGNGASLKYLKLIAYWSVLIRSSPFMHKSESWPWLQLPSRPGLGRKEDLPSKLFFLASHSIFYRQVVPPTPRYDTSLLPSSKRACCSETAERPIHTRGFRQGRKRGTGWGQPRKNDEIQTRSPRQTSHLRKR